MEGETDEGEKRPRAGLESAENGLEEESEPGGMEAKRSLRERRARVAELDEAEVLGVAVGGGRVGRGGVMMSFCGEVVMATIAGSLKIESSICDSNMADGGR